MICFVSLLLGIRQCPLWPTLWLCLEDTWPLFFVALFGGNITSSSSTHSSHNITSGDTCWSDIELSQSNGLSQDQWTQDVVLELQVVDSGMALKEIIGLDIDVLSCHILRKMLYFLFPKCFMKEGKYKLNSFITLLAAYRETHLVFSVLLVASVGKSTQNFS